MTRKRQRLMMPDLYAPPNDSPLMRVLSYSGGRQSHAIAKMCLRGEYRMPDMVVAADPGNEHRLSYEFRDRTIAEFRQAGVVAVVAAGPKMLQDLRDKKAGIGTHLDQPANWTESGGQLPQHCTRHYKIRPMDRAVLAEAYTRHGRRLPSHAIERWIGFADDERGRFRSMKIDDRRQQKRCPLIDMQMTKQDVIDWYERTGEPMPPPSVCNHCWANGVATFERIAREDPEGWKRAKEYDELARDLSQFGVREKTYCSATLLPLVQLEASGFKAANGQDWHGQECDSGVCFL